ncbi:MAG: hypothetical protein OXH99_01160 [Bryobacterales bacterium]|nr:hypothetical protein [Bryobacterales bacterium]
MGNGNQAAVRWSRCAGCGKRLAAGRRGPKPKRCRKCRSRRNNRRVARERRDREDRLRTDLHEIHIQMSWIAAQLDFHRGGTREDLDTCVQAAADSLRKDADTLLGWEVELKQRRRRRRA